MRLLRLTWVSRLLVTVMVTGLGLAAVVPVAQVAPRTAAEAYADWLRTQLDEAAGPAVEQALEAAVAAAPRSFEDFLGAFVAAFEQQNPGVRLADVLSAQSVSDEVLLRQLLRRFGPLVSSALLPRLQFISAQEIMVGAFGRLQAVLGQPVGSHRPSGSSSALVDAAGRFLVDAVRTRCAARPLGP